MVFFFTPWNLNFKKLKDAQELFWKLNIFQIKSMNYFQKEEFFKSKWNKHV